MEPGAAVVVHAPPAIPGLSPYFAEDAARHKADPESWIDVLIGFVVAGFVVYTILIQPFLNRRLIANGAASPAIVIDKTATENKEDEITYNLRYEFHPEGDIEAGAAQGKMDVTKEQFEEISIGDMLTALYWPGKPKRTVLYRFADYRVSSEIPSKFRRPPDRDWRS